MRVATTSLIERAPTPGPRRPETAWALTARFAKRRLSLGAPRTHDARTWRAWERALRTRLRATLTLDAFGPVPTPRTTVLGCERADGVTRMRIAYATRVREWATAYLLVPDRDRPLIVDGVARPAPRRRPAAICPHGHFPGGKETVARTGHAFGAAYGWELAKLGLVVLAPDNAGMGERDVAEERRTLCGPNGGNGCYLVWSRLQHLGLDLTGARVFDLMAGVNLLAARADVDARRLGTAGLSGGCWLSQVLAALDQRIRAVVLSGYFSTFAQTAWHGHCVCHHPFGIGAFCDMPDIAALIAPRGLFVESGGDDVQYPHEPAWSATRRAYGLRGAAGAIRLHRYAGGHVFHGGESLPWLVRRLAAEESA